MLLDHLDGFFAIAAFPDDLDFGILLQHSPNELAREELVVRNQGFDPHCVHPDEVCRCLARKGSCMVTVTPPSGRLMISKEYWLP